MVRVIGTDRSLVATDVGDEWEMLKDLHGIVQKTGIARASGSIPWHAVSFPDLGKVVRVRDDALELVG
jgi:hypothetical protein